MHAVERSEQIAVQEVAQQVERLVHAVHDGVAVGDDQRIALRPEIVAGQARALAAGRALGPEGGDDLVAQTLGVIVRIDVTQQRQETLRKAVRSRQGQDASARAGRTSPPSARI